MSGTVEIKKSSLLLVEGKTDEDFLDHLAEKLSVKEYVQIIDVEGKTKFRDALQALVKTTGFTGVRRLAVIRDSDDDPENSFKSIKSALKYNDLSPPEKPQGFNLKGKPSVGIFLLPGADQSGQLEDLCIATQTEHPAMRCVDQFMGCLRELCDDAPRKQPINNTYAYPGNEAKARAHAFIAAMPKPVSVGTAARRGYWKMDHPALEDLSKFLRTLATG